MVRLAAAGEQIGEREIGTLVAAIARTAALFSARDQRVIERFLRTAADELAELVKTERSLGNRDADRASESLWIPMADDIRVQCPDFA